MCGDCANFNIFCKSIGICVFANRRSVSLYTIKIRNLLEKRVGKKASYLILNTESSCPFKTTKDSIEKNNQDIFL